MAELDGNEVETLLSYQQDESSEEQRDEYRLDVFEDVIIKEEALELFSSAEETEVADESQGRRVPPSIHSNILLISIPTELEKASIFNNIPQVKLDTKDVLKIMEMSEGHDGVYLPKKDIDAHANKVIRRAPLQVIQQINHFKVEQVNERVKTVACKRKQCFRFNREDGIEFTDYAKSPIPEVVEEKIQWAQWIPTEDEDTDEAIEVNFQQQRCPGCTKLFKKISQHKCKAFHQSAAKLEVKTRGCKRKIGATHQNDGDFAVEDLFVCSFCSKTLKSKRGIIAHMKRCANNVTAVPEIDVVEITVGSTHAESHEALEIQETFVKRPLRSTVKK